MFEEFINYFTKWRHIGAWTRYEFPAETIVLNLRVNFNFKKQARRTNVVEKIATRTNARKLYACFWLVKECDQKDYKRNKQAIAFPAIRIEYLSLCC